MKRFFLWKILAILIPDEGIWNPRKPNKKAIRKQRSEYYYKRPNSKPGIPISAI